MNSTNSKITQITVFVKGESERIDKKAVKNTWNTYDS